MEAVRFMAEFATTISVRSMADRVLIQLVSTGDNRTIEMGLPQAQTLLDGLARSVGEARAFEPGNTMFAQWQL